MMHLSRMSEELVLWTSAQFDFIDLPDRFCTGSSIMPQKKNPDVPELVRGKTGRVYGHLMSLLTLMKSQPLALQNLQLAPMRRALPVSPSSPFSCQFSQARLIWVKSPPLVAPKSPPWPMSLLKSMIG